MEEQVAPVRKPGERYKMLIVDDEPDNLDLLRRNFRREFAVVAGNSAFEGLELVRQNPDIVIIITDQRMPGKGGIEMLQESVPLLPFAVRVVLTAYTDVKYLVDAINSGCVYRYVTKPWSPEELNAVVKQAIHYYELNERSRIMTAEIKRMQEYQENILRSVSNGIVTFDLEGRIQAANRAAELILGSPEATMKGKLPQEVFGEDFAGKLAEALARVGQPVTAPGPSDPVYKTQLPERGTVWLEIACSGLFDRESQRIGSVCIISDHTQQILLEEERRKQEEEKLRLRDMFGRFVAEAVVQELLRDPSRVALGGQRQVATILFADVRGFTTLSEKLDPEEVVHYLNKYLAVATESILKANGTLDKYIGDAVMAIFNAPLPQPDHAFAAAKAALGMQEAVTVLNETSPVKVGYGAGLNTGDVVVGNIGTERLMNYTAIGDTVNVAARLQGTAKAGEVLMTKATYDLISDRVEAELVGEIQVKGKALPLTVYRLHRLLRD